MTDLKIRFKVNQPKNKTIIHPETCINETIGNSILKLELLSFFYFELVLKNFVTLDFEFKMLQFGFSQHFYFKNAK